MCIPLNLIITSKTCLKSKLFEEINRNISNSSQVQRPMITIMEVLIIWLIEERKKGKESKWFHYINVIPQLKEIITV